MNIQQLRYVGCYRKIVVLFARPLKKCMRQSAEPFHFCSRFGKELGFKIFVEPVVDLLTRRGMEFERGLRIGERA